MTGTERGSGLRLAGALALLSGLGATPTGLAAQSPTAVKVCKPLVIAAAREAANELEAKKLALESWLGLARQYGEGFTRWQIANTTALTCRRLPSGAHECQAAGAPCTISQVPVSPARPKKGRDVDT